MRNYNCRISRTQQNNTGFVALGGDFGAFSAVWPLLREWADPERFSPFSVYQVEKGTHNFCGQKVSLQFTDCKPQKNYSAATAFPGLPSLVICDFIASDERAKEKGPPTKAPLLLAMGPTWKENNKNHWRMGEYVKRTQTSPARP